MRLDSNGSTRRPLFLIHGGGGGVLGYAELVRHCGAERPVYGLQASGLEGGELPPASVETLATWYLTQVRAVQPHGPYLLGGWSFGGLVAYEMARQLQAAGERVELLALLDTAAPALQPPPDSLTELATFGAVLGLPWQELPLDRERLLHLQGREQRAYLLEQVRRWRPGALELGLEALERLFAVFQRLFEARRTYLPGPYAGPTLLVRAAMSSQGGPRAVDLGWGPWLTGEITVVETPGDHFSLLNSSHAPYVAERLIHWLRNLERGAA
ncbi:alpha/beta fold hydrolase [Pyxidicoccus sp. MSG2]|nr:alpha/beta fold hydrolase [Pyxidicoccus sp. MSG2]MCY1015585.1 alpha/beta fold hydrolase [Pyxidicoccus sp. MSG2]